MNRHVGTAAVTAALVAVWSLLWGGFTVANILSGLAVVLLLFVAFPSGRPQVPALPIRPVAQLKLLGYVVVMLLRSNLTLSREVISKEADIATGVLAIPVPPASPGVVALLTGIIALSPGTMTVQTLREPPTIYVHILQLHDIEGSRADLLRLTRLVVDAFATPANIAAYDRRLAQEVSR